MIRRQFLGFITFAGVGGVATLSAVKAAAQRTTVSFRVEGFTCITCAVGLETLLGKERGVIAVKATYPEGLTNLTYDAAVASEASLGAAIESMGFRARKLAPPNQPPS